MIIAMSSFTESAIFKMLSVHTKTKSRRFQIPPVRTTISKSSVLVRVSVDGRPNRRNKAAFLNFSGVVLSLS